MLMRAGKYSISRKRQRNDDAPRDNPPAKRATPAGRPSNVPIPRLGNRVLVHSRFWDTASRVDGASARCLPGMTYASSHEPPGSAETGSFSSKAQPRLDTGCEGVAMVEPTASPALRPSGNVLLKLQPDSRIAVLGGGPAGSFFAYFLLDAATRADLGVSVDIYEYRDFTVPGPQGCNMCGGIISESLVQFLATEGISLPPEVVQRGIGSYTLHTDTGSVRIATPLQEKRIGAVHRGPGPRDQKVAVWDSFDGHLQRLARVGAQLVVRQVVVV